MAWNGSVRHRMIPIVSSATVFLLLLTSIKVSLGERKKQHKNKDKTKTKKKKKKHKNEKTAKQQQIRTKPKPKKHKKTERNKTIRIHDIESPLLQELLLHYEKNARPYPDDGGPTVCSVNCFIRGISTINENSMDFSIDVTVRQYWNDDRLTYNASILKDRGIPFLKTGPEFLNEIWLPDLFFPTERRGHMHHVTIPNRMLRIYPNGDIMISARYTITLSCEMDLTKYPFDRQHCGVQLGSYGYTNDALLFKWYIEEPISVNKDLRLPKFQMDAYNLLPCSNSHVTGNFSCLKFEFVFSIGYHIIEAYLPTTLLVFASWLGFWVDAKSVPARVTLSVTTMLTTVAQSSNVKQHLPPVSYVKAIDIWMGICTLFVFCALVEFALVNYVSQLPALREQRKENSSKNNNNDLIEFENSSQITSTGNTCLIPWCSRRKVDGSNPLNVKGSWDIKSGKLKLGAHRIHAVLTAAKKFHIESHHVDHVSRILFPLSFFAFATLYLLICTLS